MSQQNVEVVRSISQPLHGVDVTAVDWDAQEVREVLGSAYSPDLELRTLESGTGTGLGTVYRGLDGLVEYLRGWLEPFSEYHMDFLDYVEDGDRVLVPIRAWGVGRTSGARVEIELTMAYELRGDKIVRIAQYDTIQQAREAAGLEE
jgi:ketosteroid isomerase-like protein